MLGPNVEPGAVGERVLVLACGALVKELQALVATNGLDSLTIECLPAELHARPAEIPDAVASRLERRIAEYDRVLVGYADCGTAGRLDEVCERFDVERLPGEHCYQFFAGTEAFNELQDDEPGTFYLTDFLARHFDLLVLRMLGLDRHPELMSMYFGNYTRLIYLSQLDAPDLLERAKQAAEHLGLRFEHRPTGYGELEGALVHFTRSATTAKPAEEPAL